MELLCATEDEETLPQSNLSVMTCKRRCDFARSAAGVYFEKTTSVCIANENVFLLQWDGKALKGPQHTSKTAEHLAIILHSLNSPSSDFILTITEVSN